MRDIQLCDPARLRELINWLALEIGPRPRTRPDLLGKIKDYIATYFSQLGYKVFSQPVVWGKITCHNIIALPENEELTHSAGDVIV